VREPRPFSGVQDGGRKQILSVRSVGIAKWAVARTGKKTLGAARPTGTYFKAVGRPKECCAMVREGKRLSPTETYRGSQFVPKWLSGPLPLGLEKDTTGAS